MTIYTTEDRLAKVKITFDGDTVWLSKAQMAELFQRDRSVISKHIKNVFEEGELSRESNVQILHIANSDKSVEFYNLDVIISLGYRVKSQRIRLLKQNTVEVSCMDKLFYPAIFHAAEEGGFWVEFPDIPECLTQGDNMNQAYKMAVEALGLSISTTDEIPKASSPDQIHVEDGFLVVVEFDLMEKIK